MQPTGGSVAGAAQQEDAGPQGCSLRLLLWLKVAKLGMSEGAPQQQVAAAKTFFGPKVAVGVASSPSAPSVSVPADPEPSAEPAWGLARLVKETASAFWPPFQVLSGPESAEVRSSTSPSEPFLNACLRQSTYFPDVTSQDSFSSPFLPVSALMVESVSGSQLSRSTVMSESELVSVVESGKADSTS